MGEPRAMEDHDERTEAECETVLHRIARDNVARRFNVPSYHVLDKHVLRDFAMSCPKSEAEVLSMISSKASPRFQSQLRENMLKAFQIIHSSQVSS